MAFLAPLAIAATVASAGIAAVGAVQQGKAAEAAGKYNASIAANNAQIQKQNASYAASEGTAAVEAASLKNRAEMGAIKANQGASGVAINSGSSYDVRSSAAELGELNALSIRSDAARKAYGYQTESMNYTAQSGLDRAQGANAATAGYVGAGATLLGGAGSAGSSYATFKQQSSLGGIQWDS